MLASRLESIVADAIFGSRQLLKNKAVTAAAIVSLALGIGASLAAFRLVNALFLRPLPVAHPEQLYEVTYPNLFEGELFQNDRFNFPVFRSLSAAVKGQALLMPISIPLRIDLTFGSDQDSERVWRQFVSGSMFAEFGLKPALGRLLSDSDDIRPGAEPYAVISYDYWSRRFAKDPSVIGRHFRAGSDILEIVGVTPQGFTGTDPGTFTDIFVPNAMNASELNGVYRAWFHLKPGIRPDELRDRLSGALHAYREEEVKTWSSLRPKQDRDFFVTAPVSLEPVGNGKPSTQRGYLRALTILAALVGAVLLIACFNVANLMTAQAAARAREMALRISIGAGRGRLVQLLLMECGIIAITASMLGLAFSWWAGAFVVSKLNPPSQPVRLALDADWRVTIFALALTFAVTILFGLGPALRASSIQPGSVLKGTDRPRGHRRMMYALIGGQVAFCSFVLFIAGLFIATFERMANQPTGFSADRVLTVEAESEQELSPALWYQAAEQLNREPGVQSAALAEYALMSFNAQTRFVWANGHAPDGTWSRSTWFLGVSPGWFETMRLQLLAGRDFRSDDEYPRVAIVNETFARRYFGSESPVGHSFETTPSMTQTNPDIAMRIIGVARDARFEDMRMPIPATAYVPWCGTGAFVERNRNRATFLIHTKSPDPLSLASTLRRAIPAFQPAIRVINIVTQDELVQSQMVRERLLATLSLFFASVALILAAVGLYGVLNYAVLERRRELGIRIALGATARDIAGRVTIGAFLLIAVGSGIGIGLALELERYIEALLYHTKGNDPQTLVLPLITLLGAAALAALPPVARAIRIDPAALLRAE